MAQVTITIDLEEEPQNLLFVLRKLAACDTYTGEALDVNPVSIGGDVKVEVDNLPPAPPLSGTVSTTPVAPPPPCTDADQVDLIERDSSGMPWDERIHASTKTQNANGTWKKRRGVSEDTVEQVTAEHSNPPIEEPTTSLPPAPPPAPENTEVTWTWVELLNANADALKSEQYGNDEIEAALKSLDIEQFPLLATRSDLWGPFATTLGLVK